jgi:hypothetical protein
MSTIARSVQFIPIGLLFGGCAIVPDVPPDITFPMNEILLHTACELRDALRTFDTPEFKRFNARKWLITVGLNPKTDAEITPAFGLTRRVPTRANAIRFTSWALNSPGIQLDVKTERSGAIGFVFKSSDLMKDNTLPCNYSAPSYHALVQHLGIRAWLGRSIDAVYVTGTAELDKPIYDTDITIKFSGNGSYTYSFPAGTDLASLSASYTVDEQLNITFAPLNVTPSFTVLTLPRNGKGFVRSEILQPSTAVPEAQVRTDLSRIEQAIRKLPQ